MMNKYSFLLVVCVANCAVAGVYSRVVTHPGAHDGDEAWDRYSLELGIKYSADEWGAIWNYLESQDAGTGEEASIKNNLLDRLVEQDPIPPGLGEKLLWLYRERAVNIRMRDYTLQHFAPYIKKVVQRGDRKNDDDVLMMVGELQGALWNGEGALGGTALLALESLAPLGELITTSDVGTYAVNLASDEKCPVPVRTTAIQTATRLGRKEVLNAARKAVHEEQPLSLRLAAIASLGALGETSDKKELQRLQSADSSVHVRMAVRQVLDKNGPAKMNGKAEAGSVNPQVTGVGDKT